MTIYKALGLTTAIAALAISTPAFAQDQAAMDKASVENDALAGTKPMIVAKINGLVCDFCAQALTKVFKKEDVVDTLNVDLNAGEVLITLKEDQTLSDEIVESLIRKSGYSLVSIDREGGA